MDWLKNTAIFLSVLDAITWLGNDQLVFELVKIQLVTLSVSDVSVSNVSVSKNAVSKNAVSFLTS